MLAVRELQSTDIKHIVAYWTGADNHFLAGMGVDPGKIPSASDLGDGLSAQINTPIKEKKAWCIIWEVDGREVGHCNTNPIVFGSHATMHLHMWDSTLRQRGLGAALVTLTLPLFFESLQLRKIICEPYALNIAPNKTLKKVGFDFIRAYKTIPGSLSFEQTVNRWEMSFEKFKSLYQ